MYYNYLIIVLLFSMTLAVSAIVFTMMIDFDFLF
jgi:hypothetical protein